MAPNLIPAQHKRQSGYKLSLLSGAGANQINDEGASPLCKALQSLQVRDEVMYEASDSNCSSVPPGNEKYMKDYSDGMELTDESGSPNISGARSQAPQIV